MSDAALFDRFVAQHSAALLRAAWGLTGDRALAEDLVQLTLERVWLRWAQVERKSDPAAYARRVMISLFATSRRRRWWGESPAGATFVDGSDLGDRSFDHDTVLAERITTLAALARLPAKQRTVVVLRHLADLSEADTAAAMGCSVGTVKSHSSRAMRALRAAPELVDLWHDRDSRRVP